MSFPLEPIVIEPEEILESDIIIEDRKLVALGGDEMATQASNTAAKSSFYSKLIASLANSIRSKEKTDKSDWTLETYKLATEKIINLVTKTKTSVPKRFIWFRQFPKPHYVVMTRIQTINKLANDLDCQIRKIKGRESTEEQGASQQLQKPNQRRYRQRLILKVCRAVRRGMSPYQAVLLLNVADVKVQEKNRLPATGAIDTTILEVANTEPIVETELERNIRLQLRHRFLACVRSKKCIFDFANALLTMLGLPNVSKNPSRVRSKKKNVASEKASPSKLVNKIIYKNIGPWHREERIAFWKGFEQYGVPQWKKIAIFVETR
jgi:hypothetical protein